MIPVVESENFQVEPFQFPGENSRLYRKVAEIVNSVRQEGDSAVVRWTRKFDCPDFSYADLSIDLTSLVPEKLVSPPLLKALKQAAQNIEAFSKHQLPASWKMKGEKGELLGEKITPISRVGVYAPGGKAAYPSTVLMTAVPARVAGVKEIVLVTPPDRAKAVRPEVLAAAKLAGVTEMYRIGGPQAIAALAYGTASIRSVDKIVGPGNIFVQIAKKQVFGQVGIDSLAGPSEVAILADQTADPDFVAWEILAQAEHDELARSILVTNSPDLAEAVRQIIQRELPRLKRRPILEESLRNASRIVLFKGALKKGIEIVNRIASEHVSVQTENPAEVAAQITNGGAIFVGGFSPVAVGDYWAGPSHVLPTARTARFFSPLGVQEFLKRSSWIHYTREKIRQDGPEIRRLAEAEGLTAHARSIQAREQNTEQ